MSAEQYAIARRKALYLPEPDCLLLYAAWIKNKELRNTILFLELLAVDTTGGTTIENDMLMIVAGLVDLRRNFRPIRAFLTLNASGYFIYRSLIISKSSWRIDHQAYKTGKSNPISCHCYPLNTLSVHQSNPVYL
jgi:hypothetical protein